MKYIVFNKLLLLLLLSQAFNAQESCTMKNCFCDSDPTPAGVMVSHVHEKKEIMMSYRFSSLAMEDLLYRDSKISTETLKSGYSSLPGPMRMNMHMLMAMYGLTDRLTIMGMGHWMGHEMEMAMLHGDHQHPHEMHASGFGDTKLQLLYLLSDKQNGSWLLSGGFSLPTGSIAKKGHGHGVYEHTRLAYSMQTGSGTLDFLPGITYACKTDKLTFSSQLMPVLRLNKNYLGYHRGHELTLNTWFAYQCFNFLSLSLRLEGTANGKLNGLDKGLDAKTEFTADPANYGRRSVYTHVGASFQLNKGICKKSRLALEYGLPVYEYVNGYQYSLKRSINIAWSQKF